MTQPTDDGLRAALDAAIDSAHCADLEGHRDALQAAVRAALSAAPYVIGTHFENDGCGPTLDHRKWQEERAAAPAPAWPSAEWLMEVAQRAVSEPEHTNEEGVDRRSFQIGVGAGIAKMQRAILAALEAEAAP